MNDNNAGEGPVLSDELGRTRPKRADGLAAMIEQLERAEFDKWCATNGHGTLDDMMAPLDRSLKALLWSAWKGRAALRERCRGVAHNGCDYLAPCGAICNKCGQAT